jgi:hypothetical protein
LKIFNEDSQSIIKNVLFEEILINTKLKNIERMFLCSGKNDGTKKIILLCKEKVGIYKKKKLKEGKEKKQSKEIEDEDDNEEQKDNNEHEEHLSNEIKKMKEKKIVTLHNFKYIVPDTNKSLAFLDNGNSLILVKGGYWNGNIILENFTKKSKKNLIKNEIIEDKSEVYIYTTKEYSPVSVIRINQTESMALCGNMNGSIYIFSIYQKQKIKWELINNFNNHESPITSIEIHEELNIFESSSENGLFNLYTLPNFKLYNSFILGMDDDEKENLCPDIVLISDKSLPCLIIFVDSIKTLYFYSINGNFISKKALGFNIKGNYIKIYTDFRFTDYLVIYNSISRTFNLYNIITFDLIGSSQALKENLTVIDYIISDDMEHILTLVKSNTDEEKYRLFLLKYNDAQINWK